MHMFTVEDLEAEARAKSREPDATGWASYRNMCVAYYPNCERYNYWISRDVVTKREFAAYLKHGWRRSHVHQ